MIKHTYNENTLTVFLSGHIDTANAASIEKEIFDLLGEYQPADVLLDAEDLEYISSSGLRIVLKLRQRYPTLKMINVTSSVYEIFDMTGFTEMMTIEKAYRHFDVTGCQIIGKGANGTVYRIDRDTIVKVYNDAIKLEDIKNEHDLSRTAFVLGVPTAIPYDVVKVGDSFGSVFELLNAKSFDELMVEDVSNLDFVVKNSVEIAKILHSTVAPDNLPSQYDIAQEWLGEIDGHLDEATFKKLKKLIEELPEHKTMIHGDLHIKNIMLQNNETLLIDMDTLCYGHPIYELAFIFNAYRGFGITDKKVVENFLGIPFEIAGRLWEETLKAYFDGESPERLKEIEEKASVIGYFRLMRRAIIKNLNQTVEGQRFVDACEEKLKELVQKYDTLDF